jgi:hypothetical protein
MIALFASASLAPDREVVLFAVGIAVRDAVCRGACSRIQGEEIVAHAVTDEPLPVLVSDYDRLWRAVLGGLRSECATGDRSA